MLVDKKLRARLADYCLVTKQTQEQAANLALTELLERAAKDPAMKARLERVKALQQELEELKQGATAGR